MALVALGVALGLSMDRGLIQVTVVGLLVALLVLHLSGRATQRARSAAGPAGLALWSFITSSAHGAGLMLLPALLPLCAGAASVREAGVANALALSLAAVGVHTVTTLAVTGLMAAGARCGVEAGAGWLRRLMHLQHSVSSDWRAKQPVVGALANAGDPRSVARSAAASQGRFSRSTMLMRTGSTPALALRPSRRLVKMRTALSSTVCGC